MSKRGSWFQVVGQSQRVVCSVCPFQSQRSRLEDGTYGVCRRCGSVLKPAQKQAEKRRLKALKDLQEFSR
jgi:uncharacterized paraquat-inducible protein A